MHPKPILKGSFTWCGSGAAMGLKCFATATATQNGVGTHLFAAPCGTAAAAAAIAAQYEQVHWIQCNPFYCCSRCRTM